MWPQILKEHNACSFLLIVIGSSDNLVFNGILICWGKVRFFIANGVFIVSLLIFPIVLQPAQEVPVD